jgi:2,3-bisphosphoglycerate-dependent phosphoglycerate mutase
MATVILTRHGRTAANASGVLAGRSKGVHLDDLGREQARAAAGRLEGLPLAAVVTSPLERCRETAKLLAPGTRAEVERGLTECDYGSWTGQELKTLAKDKLWRVVQSQPSAARFPEGESLQEMSARAVAAVRARDARMEEEHGPHAVWVAVSHGDVIKALVADALGLHLDAFQRIVVDPGSLSVISYSPQRSFVLSTNSTAGSLAHLGRPPARKGRRSARAEAVPGGGAGPAPAGH